MDRTFTCTTVATHTGIAVRGSKAWIYMELSASGTNRIDLYDLTTGTLDRTLFSFPNIPSVDPGDITGDWHVHEALDTLEPMGSTGGMTLTCQQINSLGVGINTPIHLPAPAISPLSWTWTFPPGTNSQRGICYTGVQDYIVIVRNTFLGTVTNIMFIGRPNYISGESPRQITMLRTVDPRGAEYVDGKVILVGEDLPS